MARTWRCQRMTAGKRCATDNPAIKRNCATCGKPRPKRKVPAHRAVLATMPYEQWVVRYGERCGICGVGRSQARRLDRDHDHKTGLPRGLLCHRCNRALPHWATPQWLRLAAYYLERER